MSNNSPAKKSIGRPRKQIDYVIVERLAAIMCTESEIAAVLGTCVRTLQRDKEFCRIYKKGMDTGRASIRRSQFEMMKAGNATMAVWLGKQYLDQKDHIKSDVDVTQPIKLVVDDVDINA